MALARGHKLWGQVLIYPGLGGEAQGLASYAERANAPLLTTDDIHYYQRIRAGKDHDAADEPTFSPLKAKDFSKAPPCFVSSAEHDPLRDDGPAFVLRLTEAAVAAEVVIEPELPHGHLRARHTSARALEAFGRITAAISRFSSVS